MFPRRTALGLLSIGLCLPAGAESLALPESVAEDNSLGASLVQGDWLSGRDASIGGILFPHLHAIGAVGGSSAESIESLALGHHDPQDTWTLQTLELGGSLRIEDWLHGFAVYTGTSDSEGHVNWEWEEAFLKLPSLPGGFEVRGGRFFNRFGFQNAVHNHSWNFANQNLLNGRILQEGEIITDGGELTWNLPTEFPAAVSLSFGTALEEDGHHHHEDEEEAEFEGEGARFVDEVLGANLLGGFDYNDFHQHRVTLSGAWGDNEFGDLTQIYGIGYEYQWRENGYEPGGRYFIWRNELAYRHFEAMAHEHEHHEEEGEEEEEDEEEEGHGADLDDIALYTMLIYGFNEHLEAGVRAGWVSGISEAGLDERFRLSPNVTVSLNEERTVFARLQYDYDHSDDHGSEHSVWFQVGLNWGGPEVR